MDCPLPIDWLDYLEGREVDSAVDLDAHLGDCRRCQALVDDLREQSVGVELSPYDEAALARAPKWLEKERAAVAVGQVWLTTGAGKSETLLRRQLVLVVSERREFERTWYSAAPLTTDTDLATSTDLLLAPEDTTLDVATAVQFRFQTPLAPEQLESFVAETTVSGRELVAAAVAGAAASDRFGPPIARPNDRRLRRIEETRDLMSRLASVYGAALNEAEKAEETEAADDPATEAAAAAPDLIAVAGAPEGEHAFMLIELKRVVPAAPRDLALAAEKVALHDRWVSWFARETDSGVFRARLELQGGLGPNATLLVVIEAFPARWSSVRAAIAFNKPSGERVESPPFAPEPETTVVVASGGVGVLPTQVEQLEVRLGV